MTENYPASLADALKRALKARPEISAGSEARVSNSTFGDTTIVVEGRREGRADDDD